jgi:glutaredoxin
MALYLVSKAGCPFCSLLKLELRKRGATFTEVDASDDVDRKAFYAIVGEGVNSVPQLFATEEVFSLAAPSGRRLGGWDDVSTDWSVIDSID